MKRVHVSIDSLAESIKSYPDMFAIEPSVVKDDYAKWMLDAPHLETLQPGVEKDESVACC